MKKRVVVSIVLAVALAGAAFTWFAMGKREKAPTFLSTALDRGSIVAKVTATGTLSPLVTVEVGSQVSGRIQEILVDFNAPVKKGQILAKLDPQLLLAAMDRERANRIAAQSNLKKAEVEVRIAKLQLDRTRELAKRELIAIADLDTAQARHDTAQAQILAAQASLQQVRASLHQAQVNLDYATIVSPVDGVVISRNVDVGQTVAASLQAPTLFKIAQDLRKVQVHTNVSEADVGKLRAGLEAEFTVDAFPGETFKGRVHQLRNAPQTVQNVVTYDAVLDVSNPEQKLKPGMTANVTFIYERRDGVLRIPNAALRFKMARSEGLKDNRRNRSDGERQASEGQNRAGHSGASNGGEGRKAFRPLEENERRVWVLREARPRPAIVQTGLSDGTMTEIVEGDLSQGDRIVTGMTGDERSSGSRPGGAERRSQGGNRRAPGLF